MPMPSSAIERALAADVAAMRRFTRFFTRQLGIIEPKHLHTGFSLPEARVVYELAQRTPLTPGELVKELDIDPGQLSRLLHEPQQRRVIARKVGSRDRRQIEIALTPKGRKAFADLNRRTEIHV